MHENMVELVSRLKQSHPDGIHDFWVEFQDDGYRVNHGIRHEGDEHWCRAAGDLWDGRDSHGNSYYEDEHDDCILISMRGMSMSIVEYLLLPLLNLLVCDEVTTVLPGGATYAHIRPGLGYDFEFARASEMWRTGERRVPWSTLRNDLYRVVHDWLIGTD